MKKLPALATFILLASIVLCTIGIAWISQGTSDYMRFSDWFTAKPLDMAVDLSKPGEYQGEFLQTCQSAHAQFLFLEVSRKDLPASVPPDLFAYSNFAVRIKDKNNDTQWLEYYKGDTLCLDEASNDVPVFLARFHPFRKGKYACVVTVSEGASQLAGIPQRIVSGYELCGLESLASLTQIVAGLAIALFAALVAWFAGRRIKRFWRAYAEKSLADSKIADGNAEE